MSTYTAPTEVDIPDIQPDFTAPFFQGFQVIASYILAGAMLVVLIMLIIAGAALAFRGLASDRVRTWAGENILWIFIAAAVLGVWEAQDGTDAFLAEPAWAVLALSRLARRLGLTAPAPPESCVTQVLDELARRGRGDRDCALDGGAPAY